MTTLPRRPARVGILLVAVLTATGVLIPAAAGLSSRLVRVGQAAVRCHAGRGHRCHRHATARTVTATSGTLTATFTDRIQGHSVTFDIESTDSAATGAVGPTVVTFGDGTSEGFGIPQYCRAQPDPMSGDTGVTHDYGTGHYTATVTVVANCSADRVALSLPVTVG